MAGPTFVKHLGLLEAATSLTATNGAVDLTVTENNEVSRPVVPISRPSLQILNSTENPYHTKNYEGLSLWQDFDEVVQSTRLPSVEYRKAEVHAEPNTVVITHFNDAYGLLNDQAGDCARYAHLMRAIEYFSNHSALHMCGGDILEGYALGRYFQGEQIVDICNKMGLDFCVPGNHDFDQNIELSEALFGASEFEWVVANFFKSHGQELSGTIRSKVVEVNGIKVGVVGFVYDWENDAKGTMGLKFSSMEKHGRKQVNELRAKGAEVIVALTHMDNDSLADLVDLFPELDIVLGGHAHLARMEFNEKTNTLVLQAGMDWENMGIIAIRKENDQIQIQYEMLPLDNSIPRDPTIEAAARAYHTEFDEINGPRRAEVLTTSTTPIDTRGYHNRTRETSGGNLVADAFRAMAVHELTQNIDAHWKMFSESGKRNIDPRDVVAITNGGGIRSDLIIEAGDFTVGDAEDALPFNNLMCVLPLSGAAIVQGLEAGVSRVELADGGFPQVSGMSFDVDFTEAVGQRIKEVRVAGQKIDLNKTYYVMTNDYLSIGGNGYDAFMSGNGDDIKIKRFLYTMGETLVWYLRQMEQINPQVEGRINILNRPGQPVKKTEVA